MADTVAKIATTTTERNMAFAIRRAVFIEEQAVPEYLEQDQHDASATHFLLFVDGVAAATGRYRPYGVDDLKFERIATLATYRNQGLGARLMRFMEDTAQREHPSRHPYLHAQEAAVRFYERLGYEICGERFVEADISHYAMRKRS